MKGILTVLAISGTVICEPPGSWPMFEREWGDEFQQQSFRLISPNQDLIPPPPPYLRYVSQEAADEFFRIVANTRQTFAQQKQEILDWAVDYRVLGHVHAFDREVEHSKNLMKSRVSNLIFYLTHALYKFWRIMENQNQTPLQRKKALERLSAENPQVYEVMRFIIGKQMPEQDGLRRRPELPHMFDSRDFRMMRKQFSRQATKPRS